MRAQCGKVQTEASQLIQIASRVYGRRLQDSEIGALSSGKTHWALKRLPADVLLEAAQELVVRHLPLNAANWLEIASSIPGRRQAAIIRESKRKRLEREQAPTGTTYSLCTGCGNVLTVGTVCGCPAVENSGRPGS